MTTTSRPEPIRARFEPRLPLRLQRIRNPCLLGTVAEHRNPQRSLLPTRFRDIHPLDRLHLPGRRVTVKLHRQRRLRRGCQRNLPIDARRLAARIRLRYPPHTQKGVRPAAQHQLLQVADPSQVPVLRRLEDPPPQPSYVVLDRAPRNRVPVQVVVLRSVHRKGVQLARKHRGHHRFSSKTHLARVSNPNERGRADCRYPASYASPPLEERCCRLGFLLPFGDRHWLLGPSCSRRGVQSSSRTTYRSASFGHDGVPTFHMRKTRPGWVPLLLRGGGVHATGQMPPVAACRFSAASPAPRYRIHLSGLILTKRFQRFTHVHPSGLPLACNAWMEQTPLGLSLELRTPPLPAAHVKVGTGPEHCPGYVIDVTADLQSTSHLPHATSCRTIRRMPFRLVQIEP